LAGTVRNVGNSVEVVIDAGREEVEGFVRDMKARCPPLAEVQGVDIASIDGSFRGFKVLKSRRSGEGRSVMPPDVAICSACLGEVFDAGDRRYMYPFTVCTDCGPRFTIMERLPYDRENTTMAPFAMCPRCEAEYRDPGDRRFHAEPVCCPDCGPRYTLYRGKEPLLGAGDPIEAAAEAIDSGAIVAVKGVGGTHLVTRTTEDRAIARIRDILGRPQKPFAIMARDLDAVRGFARVGREEEELMTSFRRPIVLLRRREGRISELIAPGLDTVGVMLPYSGVHHILFHHSGEPAFVMTSANIPGEPMAIRNRDVLALGADYSLLHDRKIRNRCDDSVVKMVSGRATFLRRSRGYVPAPLELDVPEGPIVLAMGAELDVTACVLKGGRAFLTQYIGNTTKLATLEYLEQASRNLMELTKTGEVGAVAVDMHPGFSTARLGRELAEEFGCRLIKCQHHKAHLASLMAEAGVEEMVGIGVDGVGYGEDGTVWGGEVIAAGGGRFDRVGGLAPQPMPGGDLAARYPTRMLYGILSGRYEAGELPGLLGTEGLRGEKEAALLVRQMEQGYNMPPSSSAGRVLDAVAALLGVCHERTYEGEPAIKLEAFARGGEDRLDIPVSFIRSGGRREMVDAALQLKMEGRRLQDIAASFQRALAVALATQAVEAAGGRGLPVGVSGGVAYNDAMVGCMREVVEGEGLEFVVHERVPPGDGGIALGQAVMGRTIL
ncbi:MAG: carbamoyltransferase HypF, partial [Euryarchaeota archaeon]|nr:carbamoyltransferase HypF [Euryarchaeota archaeon]